MEYYIYLSIKIDAESEQEAAERAFDMLKANKQPLVVGHIDYYEPSPKKIYVGIEENIKG